MKNRNNILIFIILISFLALLLNAQDKKVYKYDTDYNARLDTLHLDISPSNKENYTIRATSTSWTADGILRVCDPTQLQLINTPDTVFQINSDGATMMRYLSGNHDERNVGVNNTGFLVYHDNPMCYYKPSDETVVNDSIPQNDNNLYITVGDSCGYAIECVLYVKNNDLSNTNSLKFLFTHSASTFTFWGYQNNSNSTGQGYPNLYNDLTLRNTSWTLAIPSATNYLRTIVIKGILTSYEAEGTINLKWAQNTPQAGAGLTVCKYSYIKAVRINYR